MNMSPHSRTAGARCTNRPTPSGRYLALSIRMYLLPINKSYQRLWLKRKNPHSILNEMKDFGFPFQNVITNYKAFDYKQALTYKNSCFVFVYLSSLFYVSTSLSSPYFLYASFPFSLFFYALELFTIYAFSFILID